MALALGLEFPEQLAPRVRDELEQLTAAIQTAINKIGSWVDVPTDGSAFTGSSAMTWTVEAGDQVNVRYMLVNKTMFINVRVDSSTVGGTLSNILRMRLPNNFTVARSCSGPCLIYDNSSSTAVLGQMRALKDGMLVEFIRFDTANYSASTNATSIVGQLAIEVL